MKATSYGAFLLPYYYGRTTVFRVLLLHRTTLTLAVQYYEYEYGMLKNKIIYGNIYVYIA